MRLRKLSILLLIVLFTILQSTALNYIRIFTVKPDILLILVIFFALNFGRLYGLSVGAACGFFSEATSGIPSGFAVFTYSLAGLILGHIGRWVYLVPVEEGGFNKQRVCSEIYISFIFSFAIYLFLFFLFRFSNTTLPLFDTLTSVILPASLYTAAVAPIMLRFLKTVLIIS